MSIRMAFNPTKRTCYNPSMKMRPTLAQMTLPELAQVILDGNARGKNSAQFLLHRKIRDRRDATHLLEERDEHGRTAAQILAQSREDFPIEIFLHLLATGATPPKETGEVFIHCCESLSHIYTAMECWIALEKTGRRILPADQGNLLHFIANKPQSLIDLHGQITDRNRSFMHRWQPVFVQWLDQPRSLDGETPLHSALRCVAVEPAKNGRSDRWFTLTGLFRMVGWFVRQGGDLSGRDHEGKTVGCLVTERLHMLTNPETELGAEAMCELARAQMDTQTPMSTQSARLRL